MRKDVLYMLYFVPFILKTSWILPARSVFSWQFWKQSNHKLIIGTIGNTYDIKDLLSKEGWKLILGLVEQWEEGGIFKGQSQT